MSLPCSINGLLPYVGWDFISECCGCNSIVGPLLGAPFIAPSAAIKAHGHGGIQYFSSVFTTKCLYGLDGIYYRLGKFWPLPGHYLAFSSEFLQQL